MSKMNILELNKKLKSYVEEVLEKTTEANEQVRTKVKEVKKLEPELLQQIQQSKDAAQQDAEPIVAVPEKAEPIVAEAPIEEKSKASEAEPVKEEKKETLAKPKKAETAAKSEPTIEKSVATKEKLEKQEEPKPAAKTKVKKEEPVKKAAPVEAEEQKPVKKEKKVVSKPAAKKADAPIAVPKKVDLSQLMPEMNLSVPQIRVVRSAEDEAAEQQKRDEQREKQKQKQAEEQRARPAQRTRSEWKKPEGQDRPRGQGAPSGRPTSGGPRPQAGGAKSDAAPASELRKPTAKRTPTKKHSTFDNRRKSQEDEIAARRRRAAISAGAARGDDDLRYRKNRKKGPKQKMFIEPIVIENAIVTGDMVSIKVLSERIGKPAAEIIKQLMLLGVMATINTEVDYDTAALVASEFGVTLEQRTLQTAEDTLVAGADEAEEDEGNLSTRPPVVTVMGHVDHGKTSLLDYIRNEKVQEGEAGGITQHIGAYRIDVNDRQITFLDTPGHEAFTAMRARGAQATDIAILVVAADDGVMPQTIEAINHATAAGVPIIVAINKMDLASANPDRIKQELTEHGLVTEEWGGDAIMVPVSAKTGEGIDSLLEMILLVADVQELKANPDRMARGTIVEARLDKGRGPVATVLVQNGTLHIQDTIIAGMAAGRVRAMYDDEGNSIEEAGPSMPVEVIGFSEVPDAGDVMYAVEQNSLSRQVIEERKDKQKAEKLKNLSKVSLDDLFIKIAEGQLQDLNIIVKADVQGSVEAVSASLEKLSNDEVRVRIVHGGVGAISESDIMLASASNAIIIGFNVRPDATVTAAAEREDVDIRLYRVIYQAIEDVENAMKGLLAPEYEERVTGHAEVRQTFKASAIGTIAGSYVLDGQITRNARVRLLRDSIVVYEGKLSGLKRFKDDAREVSSGYECGISLENYNDIKEGDIVETYEMVEVPR